MHELNLVLPSAADTDRLGAALARALPNAAAIYLYGELGAGKTALVRAALRALGHQGAVRSPTYTLLEPYELNGRSIQHLDLYRLSDPQELEYLGLRDTVDEGISLVEWPERGAGWLPAADLSIHLSYLDHGRAARLTAGSETGRTLLRALANELG